MNIVVEPVERATQAAASRIRREVFEREWKCKPESLAGANFSAGLQLLARLGPGGEPVATLSVIDTTGGADLHGRYRLPFGRHTRVARYAQLAVLRPYRGLNIPLKLILEAKERFVSPGKFQYTWLLFDFERARTSSLCTMLGYTASPRIFRAPQGSVRTLVRDENLIRCAVADAITRDYVNGVQPTARLNGPLVASLHIGPATIHSQVA